MKKWAILILIFSSFAQAYIPRGRFILSKFVEAHGRGLYAIEQEVVLTDGKQSDTWNEDWVISDGQSMSLIAKNSSNALQFSYRDGRKQFVDANKSSNSTALNKDFFEPVFHMRSIESASLFFQGQQWLPKNFLSLNTKARHSEEGVSLGRLEGLPHFVFALSSSSAALYLDQEKFLVKKLRIASGAELTADEYAEFSKGLWLPKSRTIRWGSQSAQIRLLRVRSVDIVEVRDRMQNASSKVNSNLAEGSLAGEFYQRFR